MPWEEEEDPLTRDPEVRADEVKASWRATAVGPRHMQHHVIFSEAVQPVDGVARCMVEGEEWLRWRSNWGDGQE